MIRPALAAFALGAAVPAAAQSAGAFMANPAFRDPPPAQCITTFDMQHCAAHDLRVADAAMSRAYYAARSRLGPARRQALLVDQRRWLADRDRRCLAAGAAFTNGSAAPVAVANCWVLRTRARASYLRGRR